MIYLTTKTTMFQTNRLASKPVDLGHSGVFSVMAPGVKMTWGNQPPSSNRKGASFETVACSCVSRTTHATNRENLLWVGQSVLTGD